jgi:hypothetical protein
VLLFAGLTVACVLAAGGYVAWAALRGEPASARPAVAASSQEADAQAAVQLRRALAADPRRVLFLDWDRDHPKQWGAVALAPLADPDGPRQVTPLRCERVYFTAGRGICLARTGRLKLSFVARVFGTDASVSRSVPINGIPSRARVSADGRYGSVTTFVSGHSYASPGTFSTRTSIIDLARGQEIVELEQFAVTKDGKPFDRADFNFWGVTFVPGTSRFYATLASGGKTYLIEGDFRTRRAHTLRENVECPSLSPDGTRIAFKKVVHDPVRQWRFHVLDLRAMKETALAETRSLDDQIEWLDDDRVLYQVDEQVWTVPADGTGTPRLYLPKASSPVVLQ